ncbi:hypothetical protein AB0H36_34135 [Kribbella sp. NPDC050820]|uniref:hypothetical protein n=1 Tax=Kribbella sp. NPDC050820 TaxID=3155408 RepID=UPI00340A4932
MSTIRLPIRLQRSFNNYASGALSLCVVLGTGHNTWFQEHFVELHSYQIDRDGGVFWIDFNDTYAYREVLVTHQLDLFEADRITKVSSYLIDALDAGSYVIVFVDQSRLRATPQPFLHELLIFGYDALDNVFLAVGFDDERPIRELTVPAAALDSAYRSGIEQIKYSARWNKMTAVAQRLEPCVASGAPLNVAALLERMTRYLRPESPTGFDPYDGYWWYSRRSQVSDAVRVKYGLEVYDDARAHVRAARDGLLRYDYRLIHILAEHKRMVLDRMGLALAAAGADPGTDDLFSAYRSLVADVNRIRLAGLKFSTQNAQFPDGQTAALAAVASTEAKLLNAFIDAHD